MVNVPRFHPEHGAAAVAAGCHVFAAKPVAIDVPGATTRVLLRVELGADWDEAIALQHGFKFEIHGDPDLLRPLDALLGAFARQRRMKLAGDYQPCYRVVT